MQNCIIWSNIGIEINPATCICKWLDSRLVINFPLLHNLERVKVLTSKLKYCSKSLFDINIHKMANKPHDKPPPI